MFLSTIVHVKLAENVTIYTVHLKNRICLWNSKLVSVFLYVHIQSYANLY